MTICNSEVILRSVLFSNTRSDCRPGVFLGRGDGGDWGKNNLGGEAGFGLDKFYANGLVQMDFRDGGDGGVISGVALGGFT